MCVKDFFYVIMDIFTIGYGLYTIEIVAIVFRNNLLYFNIEFNNTRIFFE